MNARQSRFGITLLAAAIAVAAGASGARAISPVDFMQRFLADPANVFGTAPGVKRGPPRVATPKPEVQPPDTPLVEVPLPHLRPKDQSAAALGYQPDDADAGIEAIATEDMPLPRLRPDDLLSTLQEKPTLPPTAPAPKVASLAPLPDLVKPPPAADSVCGMAIAQLGVISTPVKEIEQGDCGIDTPVSVTALEDGDVTLVNGATVDCHLAERLANWVHDTVKPNVEREFGEKLTGLRIAASYACRNRDNLPDTKLSEHAHGNAIDISAFRVGDRWIDVESDWGGKDEAAADFLAETRKSACGPFTTVLGPGSDVYHSNHFHLDMIKRRTAGPSKGLYCH
jgi:hypothetical protein